MLRQAASIRAAIGLAQRPLGATYGQINLLLQESATQHFAEALPLGVVVTCGGLITIAAPYRHLCFGREPRPAHKATTALLPAQCCSANDASCGNDQHWRFTNRAERCGKQPLDAIDAKL